LDVYPSATETGQTSLYEDDTLSTGYKQSQFRTTTIKTWADEATKTVSLAIGAAIGNYSNAPVQRSWVARLHRPPGWSSDLAPLSVTLNGNAIGPVVRRVRNASTMPLGDDCGAPDADVFDVTLPAGSVFTTNLLVATFAPAASAWVSSDIGNVGADGNAVGGGTLFSNSICLMRGIGAGVGGASDGFHFLYRPSAGDVQLTARLLEQLSPNTNAEAGIMIRETLDRSSRFAMMALTPAAQGLFRNRSTAGAVVQTINTAGIATPCRLRLVRHGNNFSGYASADGTAWNLIGSTTLSGFSSNAYVGLAITANTSAGNHSVDDTNCNTARFDNLIR